MVRDQFELDPKLGSVRCGPEICAIFRAEQVMLGVFDPKLGSVA